MRIVASETIDATRLCRPKDLSNKARVARYISIAECRVQGIVNEVDTRAVILEILYMYTAPHAHQ